MSYTSEVLADAPLAYYRLGEASGTTMVDSSGNGRDGAYSGTYSLGAAGLLLGDADSCVDFTNGVGTVPDAAWMDVTTITVEAIVRLDAVSQEMIVERDAQTGTNRVWQLRVNAGRAEFLIFTAASSSSVISASTLTAGVTYHLAATYDGTSVKVYIDGVLDNTTAHASTLRLVTQPITVGRSSYSAIWPTDGRVDEVAVYGAALSDARIAAHHAAAIPPPTPSGTLTGEVPIPVGSFTATVTTNITGDLSGEVPIPSASFVGAVLANIEGALNGEVPVPSGSFSGRIANDILAALAGAVPIPEGAFDGTVGTGPVGFGLTLSGGGSVTVTPAASGASTLTVELHIVAASVEPVETAPPIPEPDAPPVPSDPIVALSVTGGDGEAVLTWTVDPNGNTVDGTYEGRDGSSVTGAGAWESSAMSTGLTGSRTFTNLINGETYLLYVKPVVDDTPLAATSIAVTPVGPSSTPPESRPETPASYRLFKDFDLTTQEDGWTLRNNAKTNNGGYNRAANVTFGPSGQVIRANRRSSPITASGYTLYFDTGEAMTNGSSSLALPNYFRARAVWQQEDFHVGLWPAMWFRPYGSGEGEIDWIESFGGHIGTSKLIHKATMIKTPYQKGVQKNYGIELDFTALGEDAILGSTNQHVYEIEKAPGVIRTWIDGVLMSTHTRVNGSMSAAEWDGCFEKPSQRWYFRHTIQIGDDPDGAPKGEAGAVPGWFTETTTTLSALAFYIPE